MALVYPDPFAQLQGELERMLDAAFGHAGPSRLYPPVNVFDAGDTYVVKAELPAYHRRERGAGQFRRVVRIPGRLASDEAKAEYRDGVLTVRLPKAKEARPRRVQIEAA